MSETRSTPDLIVDHGEIQLARQGLIHEMKALEGELAVINARCEVTLPRQEYHKAQRERARLVGMITEKARELSVVKSQAQVVHAKILLQKTQCESPSIIRQITEIRDRWHEFSMDPANPQKARETAWKFTQELRVVLKAYFDSKAS